MNNTDRHKGKKNSDILLGIGTKFYLIGKYGFLCGIGLFIIITLVMLIGWRRIEINWYFKNYAITAFLSGLSCLGIGAGLPLYLLGLNYIGLGQIAKNTDKE